METHLDRASNSLSCVAGTTIVSFSSAVRGPSFENSSRESETFWNEFPNREFISTSIKYKRTFTIPFLKYKIFSNYRRHDCSSSICSLRDLIFLSKLCQNSHIPIISSNLLLHLCFFLPVEQKAKKEKKERLKFRPRLRNNLEDPAI